MLENKSSEDVKIMGLVWVVEALTKAIDENSRVW
jgi:hypothetical protein